MQSRKITIPIKAARASLVQPALFLLLLGGIMLVVRSFQLQEYLDTDLLRRWVAGYGMWAPVVYLLVWTLAPAFLVPATPILLVGGVLFGPFWGEVYVIIGATAGATLAFLVARYFTRDWVAYRIAGTRLEYLDNKVARWGWKLVAFTRIVPIFPYFLVNYAFGLTRVSLLGFILATFFGMLPLTTAYVVFSANLLDLIRGKLSWEVILGAALVTLVASIPFVYKIAKTYSSEESIDL